MLGTTIGECYQIVKKLASGGFGDTYLVEDPNLPQNQQCVVKFLKPNIEGLEPSDAQKRFRREAKTLQTLGNHPQIPQLLVYYAESFCLVQEYIEGCDSKVAVGRQGRLLRNSGRKSHGE